MNATRKYWMNTVLKIAMPVLNALAGKKLKETMPVEGQLPDRPFVTHLEAFGRTLAGIAPWLETPATDAEEEALRIHMAELARSSIANAVDPDSPDYLNFTDDFGDQPLVDAAYVAEGIIRAPKELWEKLDRTAQSNLVNALKQTRKIITYRHRNNWLLFPAMIEAALYKMTGECDLMRVDYAMCVHEQWYKGDGIYGDGPEFHWDYYNSYVIQPMLLEVTRTLKGVLTRKNYGETAEELFLSRSRRYAAILERLIATDGTFPAVGRSITYRTGAFHALAQMALWNELPDGVSPAQVRCALTAVIKKCFEAKGTFDRDGWLTIGLCGHQPSLGDYYISTGSLYLCTLVFLPLGLPSDHPFWNDPDEPYTAMKIWGGIDCPADDGAIWWKK